MDPELQLLIDEMDAIVAQIDQPPLQVDPDDVIGLEPIEMEDEQQRVRRLGQLGGAGAGATIGTIVGLYFGGIPALVGLGIGSSLGFGVTTNYYWLQDTFKGIFKSAIY